MSLAMSEHGRPLDDDAIGALVHGFTDRATAPFDPRAVARLAIGADAARRTGWTFGRDRSPLTIRWFAIAAALLTAALIGGAALVGAFGPPRRSISVVAPSTFSTAS